MSHVERLQYISLPTAGEVTSHNLWSRHDRHFVGGYNITRGVKRRRFYVLLETKSNHLVQEEHVHIIVNKAYFNDITATNFS